MPRFLAIGRSRVQLLEAVAHDPADARCMAAALETLEPKRIHVDLTPIEARLVEQGGGSLAPFATRAFDAVASCGPAEPNALYRIVSEWAAEHGATVELLLPDLAPAPEGRRWPRPTGLRRLDRMLRREGFSAADSRTAVARLDRHYASRVPELAAWLEARRDLAAKTLVRGYDGRGEDGVAVLAFPEADTVADRVYRLLHPNPS